MSLKQKWIGISNWLNGWRKDHGGWWVRARREHDHLVLGEDPFRGFVEEACVAVMHPVDAYNLDRSNASYFDLCGEALR